MRRFTAVFAVKRSDKSNAGSIHSANATSLLTESGNSSTSSSSAASLYPPTPDEDNQNHHLNVVDNTTSHKKTWKTWFKSSSSARPKQPSRPPVPDWKPSKEAGDDSLHNPENVVGPDTNSANTAHRATHSPLATLVALVDNSLVPPPSPPSPFIQTPNPFPRSVNSPHTFTPYQNLHVTTLKKRLRARLADTQYTPSKVDYVLLRSLSTKQVQPRTPVAPPLDPSIDVPPDSSTVLLYSSPGIQRWLDRPCFEERYFSYAPDKDGGVAIHSVTSSYAVAALEFSAEIESLADADFAIYSVPLSSPSVLETPSLTPDIRSTSPSSSPALSIVVPAPPSLPSDHTPPPSSPELQAAPIPISAAVIKSTEPLVKRGVRFAEEDDKEETIPIGYVLRMRKNREEKAQFLKAEKERRAAAVEESRQLEQERQKRAQERAAWEQERKAWEQEKRAIEEKKRRMYAEEVIAARLRSESQRVGGVPGLQASNTESLPPAGPPYHGSAPSSASERNRSTASRRQSRQMWDSNSIAPRSEASQSNLSLHSRPPTLPVSSPMSYFSSPVSGSPGSSSPSSFRGTPPTSSNPGNTAFYMSHSPYSSQPGSSSEDVRAARAAQRNQRRGSFSPSMAPSFSRNNSSNSLVGDRAVSYPTVWTGSHASLNSGFVPPMVMPPMMPMGYTMMDMPLLPPSAPFMMQQYPKQRGSSPARRSGSGSGSSRGQVSSRESSRERDGSPGPYKSGHPSRSASFPDRPVPLHTSSAPAKPIKSGDPRRSSAPVSPQHQNHYSQRPAQPHHTHSQPSRSSRSVHRSSTTPFAPPPIPSPWTGVATQSGSLPNANASMKPTQSRSSARKSMIT